MKIILFAGGSGKRFWPKSRLDSPKQFLNVTEDKPLVRVAFERLLTGFGKQDIFISTGKRFEKEVNKILPELPEDHYIFDPDMRETGPAVTLSVSYVQAKFPSEIIAVIWSDYLIKDVPIFIENLKQAEEQVKESGRMVFITVPIRFPSVHLGYIQHGKEFKDIPNKKIKCMEFKQFEEKPNQEVANEYFASKEYSWNLGFWIFKGNFYLEKVKQTSKEIYKVCQEVVKSGFASESLKKFSKLEKIPADYIFAEKVLPKEALVFITEMGWSDVGEWNAIKEAYSDKKEDNVIKGNVCDMGSKDTIIHNYQKNKLVATIGLDGYVVVNTKDVIAVFKKEDNAKLKEYLKRFEGTDLEKYL